MPIYEYRCTSCKHEFEALQKLSDAVLTECPACHRPDLTKLVSAAGFQLKGSGWYVTDFRNSGAKPPAKAGTKTDANAKAGVEKSGGDGTGATSDAPAAAATGDSKGGDIKTGDSKAGDAKKTTGSESAASGSTGGKPSTTPSSGDS